MTVCRPGADPWPVIDQPNPTKIRLPASVIQVPIGVDSQLESGIDLV
jgi:hypothetical protein